MFPIKEVREVLLALGVASETADDYLLRLFPQNQELTANSYSVWQTHFKQADSPGLASAPALRRLDG